MLFVYRNYSVDWVFTWSHWNNNLSVYYEALGIITFTIDGISRRDYLNYSNVVPTYIVRVIISYDGLKIIRSLLIEVNELNSRDIKQSFIDTISKSVQSIVEIERTKDIRKFDIDTLIGESFTI